MSGQTRMKCGKYKPCKSCPFRSDLEFMLTPEKVVAILAALHGDDHFACHNTTVATGCTPGSERSCIGAAIFMEHVRVGGARANRMFRERELHSGDFSHDALDMSASVFTDVANFVAARVEQPVCGGA